MPPASSNIDYIEVSNLDQKVRVNAVAWQQYITYEIEAAIF